MSGVAPSRPDGVEIVWFKRDLRVEDHRPLADAARRGRCVCLYVYEPEVITAPDFDASHLVFLNESLAGLDRALRKLGGQLTVRTGRMPEVLECLHRDVGIAGLWSHEETGNAITYSSVATARSWRVPDAYIAEPHTMPADLQRASGCLIGRSYPAPIVEHRGAYAQARARMHAVKSTAAARELAGEVYSKHGSRRRPRRAKGKRA